MCYCATIKEMMKTCRETNKPVVSTSEKGTFYVRYYDEFDDYTFQYSWKLSTGECEAREQVANALSKYPNSPVDVQNLDVVQFGMVSVYHTNADVFCQAIEHAKEGQLEPKRETITLFAGKKVLRIAQYYGQFANPFLCIGTIKQWNGVIADEETSEMVRGIGYYFSTENDSIVFSIGYDDKKTVFSDYVTYGIPQLLCIDTIQGVSEYCMIDNNK